MSYYLSIIIPMYNEQNRIPQTLKRVAEFVADSKETYEIIVVDDGSTDHSVEVVETLLKSLNGQLTRSRVLVLSNGKNKGKGYSVRKGVLAAQGRYVLFSDADLSTPIEETGKMIEAIESGYNIAIGSRALRDSDIVVRQNIIRQSMGKFFNLLVRKMTRLDIHDTQCGFKCFDRKAVTDVFTDLTIDDFSFDVELLYLAKLRGLKIKEVGVRWENSTESKVGVFKDSLAMFLNLTKIRKIHKE